tara:strand:+ start:1245 stop:1592 length:348 start_codon:yes stop_codon:yes gene_type:complete
MITKLISEDYIDHRGRILSFIPTASIKEFVMIETKSGVDRGDHLHPEFDEYIVLIKGNGKYIEKIDDVERTIEIVAGECIHIPTGVYHTFIPSTDCIAMSCLTKKWNDCKTPIIK